MTPRNTALQAGETFYKGNVCESHPDLNGKRRAKSGGCPKCIVDRMAKHRTTAKYERAKAARQKRRREARRAAKEKAPSAS
jgi:hypothetical protein